MGKGPWQPAVRGLLIATSLDHKPSRPFASTSRVGIYHGYKCKTNLNVKVLDFVKSGGPGGIQLRTFEFTVEL